MIARTLQNRQSAVSKQRSKAFDNRNKTTTTKNTSHINLAASEMPTEKKAMIHRTHLLVYFVISWSVSGCLLNILRCRLLFMNASIENVQLKIRRRGLLVWCWSSLSVASVRIDENVAFLVCLVGVISIWVVLNGTAQLLFGSVFFVNAYVFNRSQHEIVAKTSNGLSECIENMRVAIQNLTTTKKSRMERENT